MGQLGLAPIELGTDLLDCVCNSLAGLSVGSGPFGVHDMAPVPQLWQVLWIELLELWTRVWT